MQVATGDANLIEGARKEYVEAAAPIYQHLGEARGAHDWADHERVAPQMRDTVGVVFLVEGDGRLGPSDTCQKWGGCEWRSPLAR